MGVSPDFHWGGDYREPSLKGEANVMFGGRQRVEAQGKKYLGANGEKCVDRSTQY